MAYSFIRNLERSCNISELEHGLVL
jgi:hypothetical protein